MMYRCLASAAVLLCAAILIASGARAQDEPACDVPSYFLFGDAKLGRVAERIRQSGTLDIVVVGTGSSMIAGNDNAGKAYPARLETALRRRLKKVPVSVVSRARSRQTTAEMAGTFDQLLDTRPALVLWQTGTYDAIRGIDPDHFRALLDGGVSALQAGGVDVVLINMQFSPRTETMLHLNVYADHMRLVARDRDVPLFDRMGLMRYWSDGGTFDLYAAARNVNLAARVHDCIGRALAALIVDAAELETYDAKAGQ